MHARAHRLAQRLDVGGGGAAEIDQEVAVQLRHLRVADLEAAAAGGVDQLPGLVAGRVLEGRAAGAALDRLRRLARLGDLVHLGGDRGRIARRALEQRLGEDDVLGRAAMAIGVVHVAIGEDAHAAVRGRRRAPRSARPWSRGHRRRRSCAARRRSRRECRARTRARRCRLPAPRARPSRRAPRCRRGCARPARP